VSNKYFRALPWQELLLLQDWVRNTVQFQSSMYFCIKVSVFFIERFAAHEEISLVTHDDLLITEVSH